MLVQPFSSKAHLELTFNVGADTGLSNPGAASEEITGNFP